MKLLKESKGTPGRPGGPGVAPKPPTPPTMPKIPPAQRSKPGTVLKPKPLVKKSPAK